MAASSRWSLIAACAVAAVGGGLAVRALWPRQAPSVVASEAPAVELPQFSLPVSPEFETMVPPEAVASVAREVRSRAEATARRDGRLPALGVEAFDRLLAAVEEQAAIYLGGSWDMHWAFLQRTGARVGVLDQAGDDAAARERTLRDLRTFWESSAAGIANRPVSMEEVTLRPRYLAGKRVSAADERHAGNITTSIERWPLFAAEPSANGYTIAELLIPVFYVYDGKTETIYFAIWLVWDASQKEWLIHQTRAYSPTGRPVPVVMPTF